MNSIVRIILYGIQGFRRNIWLSVIAIITMTLTITTITIFALGNVVANNKYQEFNSKIDYNVFTRDEASDADVSQLESQIKALPIVQSVSYQSKEDARKNFESLFPDDESFKGVVTSENNPLPREIDVKLKDPNQIDQLDQFVHQTRFDQVVWRTSYRYNKSSISNYLRVTNFLKIFGFSFTIFFVLIAILVILNTIRLAIFSRREEIEIMRLVGATRGYIRGPFLVEGVFFGLLGALISGVIAWVVLRQLEALLALSFKTKTTDFVTNLFGSSLGGVSLGGGLNTLFTQLFAFQLAVGLALGVICSFIAVRRYLKE